MSLEILPYSQDAVPAVREFNQRLLAGGAPADQQFPETPDPGWMPGMELAATSCAVKFSLPGASLFQPLTTVCPSPKAS